jgi:hypothetical protein
MSEIEIDAAQGRAYREHKQASSNITTLQARLSAYATDLSDASQQLKTFIREPIYQVPGGPRRVDSMRVNLTRLFSQTIVDLLAELVSETERLQDIEDQISRF